MRRPGFPWPAYLTAGVILLIAVPIAPAETNPLAAFQVGTEVFRRILHDRGFTPLDSFDQLGDHAEQKILIVFGAADRLTEVHGGLRDFVERGGALFLATDKALRPDVEEALDETAGVHVSGHSIVCKTKESCYRQLPFCPFLLPSDRASADLFRNLTLHGATLSNVATNAPSYLESKNHFDGVSLLASLPEHCFLESAPGYINRPPPFAAASHFGAGRVLVLADHSVFINEMMLPADNDNVEFTYNCLEWLRGDAKVKRTQVLFVEDGRINKKFEVPLKEMPDELAAQVLQYLKQHPDEAAKLAATIVANHPKETAQLALNAANAADKAGQKLAPEIERKTQEVDEDDGFNNGLLQGFGDPNDLLRDLAVWLAVLVVLYGCYKIGWKARRRTDLQGPLLASALYQLAPVDTVVEQRRRDLIRGGNLWEAARDMARQCLAASGLPSAVPPRVVVQGGWLRRWTMAGRVRRLWRLAYGPPARVSLREWQRLLREVQNLKTALASGAVRFQG